MPNFKRESDLVRVRLRLTETLSDRQREKERERERERERKRQHSEMGSLKHCCLVVGDTNAQAWPKWHTTPSGRQS